MLDEELMRLLMGAAATGIIASTAALIRVLVKVARLEERVSDVERDLLDIDQMALRMWKSIQSTELTVTRLEERHINRSNLILDELRKLTRKE